jgi:glycerol-3-phosphate cytidylyltransferase
MKTIITYGTFDLFHFGHLKLLERLKQLGDRLVVGVSTDEFDALKGKRSLMPFEQRVQIMSAIKFVDLVIAENSWDQKVGDIKRYGVDVFAMGDDWTGKFDFLREHCEVIYLSRTQGVSSTSLKHLARALDSDTLARLTEAHAIIEGLLRAFRGGTGGEQR